jgi:aminoglycoside/choline kinase family phosphotransferase
MSDAGALKAGKAAAALGLAVTRIEPVEGDASRRVFYRLFAPARTAIAAVYPEGAEEQVEKDVRAQRWGWSRRLPIPEPLGHVGLVTLSEDLGSEDLERAVGERGETVLDAALDTLQVFQACRWDDCPMAPFDGALFRRELAVFEQQVVPTTMAATATIAAFLDGLAARLEQHPYRLVHRDFHVNNLFLQGARVRAVDYQDMRGGPDTYDAVSLLRERAGGECIESDLVWRARAASILGWAPGWEDRYLECAAQRGLKVVGTFVRLAGSGRTHYLRWLPLVQRRAREALEALAAPGQLIDILRSRDA